MKALRVLSIVLSMVLFVASASFAADSKIGYVDLSRLFDEYQKTKDYDKVLEEKHKDFEKNRNDRIEKIRAAQGELALLAEDKKADKDKEIEALKNDLLEYDRQKKNDLTKDRNEKIREILLEIEKKVSDYAEKEQYSLILNDRVLIYGNKTVDLTEDLLKIINQK